MAFTTVQGSGANDATSYVGSSGVDAIAIVNSDGNFFAGAQASADVISINDSGSALYAGVLSGTTMKGGQGADTISTAGNARGMVFANGFINLNKDDDILALRAADSLSGYSVFGGQGADQLTLGIISASFVNGHKDNDTINLGGASSGSTIYGGQGNDSINLNANLTSGFVAGSDGNDNINDGGGTRTLTNTTIQGNAGNDTLNFTNQTTTVRILGGADNDTITSGTAGDIVSGDNGNDSITAAAGNDTMAGGAGIDTFAGTNATSTAASAINVAAGTVFAAGQILTFANGVDQITDFVFGTDRLDLAGATTTVTGIGVANNVNAVLNYGLSGTFNAAAGTFTIAADSAGSDTLMMTGVNGAVTANASFIVLSGVSTNVGITVI